MRSIRGLLIVALMIVGSSALAQSSADSGANAAGTAETRLSFPQQYRQWIYLTSGFDMSYSAAASGANHLFDNLFVNPEAYRSFLASGSWPDGSMLVLELRRAVARDALSRQGAYQGGDVVGVEVHLKDRRVPGQWSFFSFRGNASATRIAQSADCYACHGAHGAVDTTFVQYYPTLLPVARSKGTLSAAYRQQAGEHTPASR